MLLEQTGQTNTFKGQKFKVEVSATAFTIMSSSLYSQPTLACVRELMSNAIDAHDEWVAAGGTADRATVNYDQMGATLVVTDNGSGMNERIIETTYATLFSSTKSGSDESTGGFGVGALSAFAIADAFTVETRCLGEAKGRCYYVSKDNEGIPSIRLLSSEIEMDRGTKITVENITGEPLTHSEVEQLNTIAFYRRESVEFMQDGQPVDLRTMSATGLPLVDVISIDASEIFLSDQATISFSGGTAIPHLRGHSCRQLADEIYSASKYDNRVVPDDDNNSMFKVHILQGSNIYSVDGLVRNNGITNTCNVLFEVPVGTFSMPPSREELRKTPENTAKLISLLSGYYANMQKSYFALHTSDAVKHTSGIEVAKWLLADSHSERNHISYNYESEMSEIVGGPVRAAVSQPGKYVTGRTGSAVRKTNVIDVFFTKSATAYSRIDAAAAKGSRYFVARMADRYRTEANKTKIIKMLQREMSEAFPFGDIEVVETKFTVNDPNFSKGSSRRTGRMYAYLTSKLPRASKKADIYHTSHSFEYSATNEIMKEIGGEFFPVNEQPSFQSVYRSSEWADRNDPHRVYDAATHIQNEILKSPTLLIKAVEAFKMSYYEYMLEFLRTGDVGYAPKWASIEPLTHLAAEGYEKALLKLEETLGDDEAFVSSGILSGCSSPLEVGLGAEFASKIRPLYEFSVIEARLNKTFNK